MNRQKAREYMMTVLFQMEALGDFDVNEKDRFLSDSILRESSSPDNTFGSKFGSQKEYCETVYSLACNKIDRVDDNISQYVRKWSLNRMPKADLAIIRLAALEILYMEDIPDSVSINEAVELAKKYCEESSPSYINGILGAISRNKSTEKNS